MTWTNQSIPQSIGGLQAPLPYINPLDYAYGCVGDGVADDTAGFTAALTATAAAHGTLLLPPGKSFLITSAIAAITTSGWRIVGYGGSSNQPEVKFTGDFTGITIGTVATITEQIQVSGVKFTGASGGSSQHAFDLTKARFMNFEYCTFTGFSRYPIYVSGGDATSGFLLAVDECDFTFNTQGAIFLSNTGNVTKCTIRNCYFGGNTLSVASYANGRGVVDVRGYIGMEIEGNYFNDTTVAGTSAEIFGSWMGAASIKKNTFETIAGILSDGTANINSNDVIESNVFMATCTSPVSGTSLQDFTIARNEYLAATGTATSLSATSWGTFEDNVYAGAITPRSVVGANPSIVNDGLRGLVYASVANATTIANTAAQTAFDKSVTIPANSLAAGSSIIVNASGTCVSAGATTLILRVRFGGNTVEQFATVAMPAVNGAWSLSAPWTQRTIGASVTARAAGGIATVGPLIAPATMIVGVLVNTTADAVVDITAQMGDAASTVIMGAITVKVMRAGSTS